jgi:hypothetical protein
MQNAAFVGVCQSVRQAGPDPQDRLDMTEPIEQFEVGRELRNGRAGSLGRRVAIASGRRPAQLAPQRVHQLPPGAIRPQSLVLQQRAQSVRADIRHAHDLVLEKVVNGIDRDNVGVLQAGQPLRFAVVALGYFQGHQASAQVALRREEHTAEGAAAQFADQFEVEQRVANGGSDRWFRARGARHDARVDRA